MFKCIYNNPTTVTGRPENREYYIIYNIIVLVVCRKNKTIQISLSRDAIYAIAFV